MKLILTSTNDAKIEAVKKIAEKLFREVEIVTLKVETGVSKTPLTDEEGIEGAINRIKEAKRIDDSADFYVGLEGILVQNKYGSFICGWAVVESKDNRQAYGCSGKVQLPPFITNHIVSFKELSDEVKKRYPSGLVEEMAMIGSNGIITNHFYTRVDEFEDALICAFGYMANEINYQNS